MLWRKVRLNTEEAGFTLVEAMVALVIIFGLLVVLLRTFDSGVGVLVETRRQSAASRLASELIERAQALEWQHMGLATSNNGSDCATGQVGCFIGNPFNPADLQVAGTGYEFGGEKVVFSNSDTFAPFLSFHSVEDRGGTDFDRYLFVTSIVDPITGNERARRLTAVIQWLPPEGFRKEVRLETIVSEYREPSQPLISGEITYSGGEFSIGHRDDVALDGSGVDGTKGWSFSAAPSPGASGPVDFVNTPRPPLTGLVVFPGFRMDAVSDFVSGSDVQLTSTNAAELNWNGVASLVPPPTSLFHVTDDDASSVPPLNIDPISLFAKQVEGYHYAGPGLEDVVVAETVSGYAISDVAESPSDKTGINRTQYSAELWSQRLDGTSFQDELPYVVFQNDLHGTPDRITVGFSEYEAFSSLARPVYDFRFYQRGTAEEAYLLKAWIDRTNVSTSGERSILGQLEFFGDEIRLFDDDAHRAAYGPSDKFEGFVKIETPQVAIRQVAAGEGVLAPPTLQTTGDLVVYEWNPALSGSGGYAEVARLDYEGLTGACNVNDTPVEVDLWGGGTVVDSLRDPNDPYIDYAVSGSITVRGWCSEVETDGLGNVSRSIIQTYGPMVSGDIQYSVTDVWWREYFATTTGQTSGMWGTYSPGEMPIFDVNAHFETDALRVSTVFEDPNAG